MTVTRSNATPEQRAELTARRQHVEQLVTAERRARRRPERTWRPVGRYRTDVAGRRRVWAAHLTPAETAHMRWHYRTLRREGWERGEAHEAAVFHATVKGGRAASVCV